MPIVVQDSRPRVVIITDGGAALADAVVDSDFTAQTVLVSVASASPAAQTVGDSEFVGRPAGGDVGVMTAAQARTVLDVAAGAKVAHTASTTAGYSTAFDPSGLAADGLCPTDPLYKAGAGTTVAGKVYNLVAGTWTAVDSDTAAGAGVSGLLAVAVGTSPSSDGMMTRGYWRPSTGLTGSASNGDTLVISGTAGTVQIDNPGTYPATGQFGRVVGEMITATIATFDPDRTWWEEG